MEEILYGLLREQGIWAVLFVALLCYVLRKNEEQDKQEAAREAACQELLKQFAEGSPVAQTQTLFCSLE